MNDFEPHWHSVELPFMVPDPRVVWLRQNLDRSTFRYYTTKNYRTVFEFRRGKDLTFFVMKWS